MVLSTASVQAHDDELCLNNLKSEDISVGTLGFMYGGEMLQDGTEIIVQAEDWTEFGMGYIADSNNPKVLELKNIGTADAKVSVTVKVIAGECADIMWCGITTQCKKLTSQSETRSTTLAAGATTRLNIDTEFEKEDNTTRSVLITAVANEESVSMILHLKRSSDSSETTGVKISEIQLNTNKLSLFVGESFQLKTTITPKNATNPSLNWYSSDETVVTVVGGMITAMSAGTATIVVSAADGSGVCAICNLDVVALDETSYDYNLQILDAETRPGNKVTLSLNLNNIASISDYQCDLYLPEGFSVALDEDGYEMIYLSEVRTNSRQHVYSYSVLADGAIRLISYSNGSSTFSGKEGEVLTITLDVAEDMEDGDYTLFLKNIEMTEPDGTQHKVPQTRSKVTVSSYTLGDVNDDGSISITDVRGVVNMVLAAQTPEDNPAADVNVDGSVSIADVRGVVNMVLNPVTTATAMLSPKMRAASSSSNLLYVEPFTIAPGEEKEVMVMLNNPGDSFSDLQFDIYLPEGIEIVSDEVGYLLDLGSRTTSRKHNLPEGQLQSDGSVRVICYSSKAATFAGESGDVIIIPLKAADNLAAGIYNLEIKGVELARLDMSKDNPADYRASVISGSSVGEQVVLKGYFSTDAMNEISTAMADATNVAIVDLTEAVYVEPSGVMSTGNANTLFLLQEGMSMGNDANVVVGNVCENLELADAQAFHAPFNFTAETMTFARNFAQATIATFVLPMEIPVASVNGRVYKVGDVEGNVLKLEEVTHGNLEAHQPYIVEVAEAGELLTGSLNDVTIVSGTEQPSYAVDGILHVGTYQRQEVASDAYNTYYGFTGGEFVKANTGVLKPFRTMICVPGASATNSYKLGFGDEVTAIDILDIELQGLDVYDLSGRKVAKPSKGVYIINGKKVYVK